MELLQNTTESLEKLYAEDMAKASFKAKKIETEDDVLSIWKDQSFSDLYSTRLMEGAAVSLILLEMFLRMKNQLANLLLAVPEKYDFNDELLLHRSRRNTIDFLPHGTRTVAGNEFEPIDNVADEGVFGFSNESKTFRHREERDVLGAVAIGMSLWNAFKISNLEHHMANLSSKYNVLIDSTNLLNAKHNQLATDVLFLKRLVEIITQQSYRKITAMSISSIDRLRDTVDSVVSIVTSGRQRRVSPRLLNGDTLAEAYLMLLRKAKDMNCELLLAHPTDIYNVQATYGYSQEGLVFEIIAHVPMVSKSEKLALFEHVPFPIAFQSRMSKSTITPNTGSEKYLAVIPLSQSSSSEATHKFKVMNEVEFQSCFVLRNHYICSSRNTLRLDIKSSCIASLWLKDHELISKNCELKIEPPQEVVAKLSPKEWLIYSPVSITKSITCGTNIIDNVRLERQTRLTLVEDCELTLEKHYISTDVNILVDFQVKVHDWKYYGSVFTSALNDHENVNDIIDEVMATRGKFGIQDLTHLKHYFETSSDVLSQMWKAISKLNIFSIFGNVYSFLVYVFIIWLLIFACRQGWITKMFCPKKEETERLPIIRPMRAPSIGLRPSNAVTLDIQGPPPYEVAVPSAPLLNNEAPMAMFFESEQPTDTKGQNECLIKPQDPSQDPLSFTCHMHDPVQGCSGTFGQVVKKKSGKNKAS